MKLSSKDVVNLKIGNWNSSLCPDGTVLWSHKPIGFITKKDIKTAVIATPHYDKLNEVAVDVYVDFEDDSAPVLQTSFRISGYSVENDRKMYIEQMTAILSILK